MNVSPKRTVRGEIVLKYLKREKSTSTRGHYVTNAQLLPAVLEAKELGKVTDKLIGMIWMIAERYSRKGNFVGYSFREDMVAAAIANLCNNALKFNPEKSANPFSFYTTAIHNSFLQYMADEKKHRKVRDRLLIESGANPSYNYGGEENHEVVDSDASSYRPATLTLDEDDEQFAALRAVELDGAAVDEAPKEKVIKHRYLGRQPSAVKVLVPGVDFTQDEEGNITFMNSTDTMSVPAAVQKKPRVKKVKDETTPKATRKKKVVEVKVEAPVAVVEVEEVEMV
jgi:hypothetical protein